MKKKFQIPFGSYTFLIFIFSFLVILATCRNPTNGKWYLFDDFSIEEVPEEFVSTKDAYILFYQVNCSFILCVVVFI